MAFSWKAGDQPETEAQMAAPFSKRTSMSTESNGTHFECGWKRGGREWQGQRQWDEIRDPTRGASLWARTCEGCVGWRLRRHLPRPVGFPFQSNAVWLPLAFGR